MILSYDQKARELITVINITTLCKYYLYRNQELKLNVTEYTSVISTSYRNIHRRSQDFVSGALFLTDDLFLVVALKERLTSKYTSKSNPPNKNCPKN